MAARTYWEEEVEFASGREELRGKVFIPQNGASRYPGVVLSHGVVSDHREMAGIAQELAQNGVAALAFDLRGHGQGGSVWDRGMLEDIPAAFRYLAGFPQVDEGRIALVGHSMGAKLALCAAGELPQAAAMVLLACLPDIKEEELIEFRRFYSGIPEGSRGYSDYPRARGLCPG